MKRTNISLLVVLLAFLMSNCGQHEIPASMPEINVLQDDGERISYLKKSATTIESDQSQQSFELKFASIFNDSTISLQIFYLTTDDYKLHDFDFVWDEKLVDDSEGKTWMNFEVYHKTNAVNASTRISDSVKVEIPDLLKFNTETISKLWLRFVNSTDKTNMLTLKYGKTVLPENGSVSQDSVVNNGTGNTPADSLQTGNTPNPGTGRILPSDSTMTNGNNQGSGTENTPADSLQTGNTPNPGNGGILPADSTITNGNNQGSGTVIIPQDSLQTGGTTVKDSLNHTGEVIFNYKVFPAEIYFLNMDNESSFATINIWKNQARYAISRGKNEKQPAFIKKIINT